ncbi:MAG TPA: MarR family transcriptional regulator, partial [Candidatus Udaeobacter sp.]|nr:MarR family transcriptional regulator [Candidatus Udaeobacter sp.]
MNNKNDGGAALSEARDQFVSQWGVIGSAWGVNRTMAQIHALLITAPAALSTDDIMQELKISRGNAHSNLRDLVSWGLVRTVVRKGERKEFFEAEKDVWKMFCIIL